MDPAEYTVGEMDEFGLCSVTRTSTVWSYFANGAGKVEAATASLDFATGVVTVNATITREGDGVAAWGVALNGVPMGTSADFTVEGEDLFLVPDVAIDVRGGHFATVTLLSGAGDTLDEFGPVRRTFAEHSRTC